MKTKLLSFSLLFFTTIIFSQCFTTVSTRYNHAVGVKPDGTIWGWGWGNWGQLNNGTDGFDEYNPIPLSGTSTWQFITSGQYNTFAINTNGTLWACGGNLYGSLGIGSSADNSYTFTQLEIATNWKKIAASDFFTIGLKLDGTLWGWGINNGYQVGDATTINRLSPVQIGTATDWKTIGTSKGDSGFAIKNNGTLWCWGTNIAFLLGDGAVSERTTPTQHNPATDWDKMSVGNAHILVLKTNATLWAWGAGQYGQTGQDPTTSFNTSIPYQIAGVWKSVGCGDYISMGIKTDGTLWAWGKNDVGQLGDGGTANRYIPVQLGTATNWDTVSCGYQHTVALRTDGSLWTWGTNDFGQLGNGGTTAVATPTNIPIAGCTLGVEEFTTQNTMQISPNPVSSELTINYKGIETIDTIVLYDITGKEVYTLEALGNNAFSSSFSIAQLQSGTYVVVLKNKGKSIVSTKMIKE